MSLDTSVTEMLANQRVNSHHHVVCIVKVVGQLHTLAIELNIIPGIVFLSTLVGYHTAIPKSHHTGSEVSAIGTRQYIRARVPETKSLAVYGVQTSTACHFPGCPPIHSWQAVEMIPYRLNRCL